ncbi:MAG: efflux RND transporter permease subunit [Chlorobi bacterium]|nr:efflux RND transporter permease subunit [Chlorobiota bacterium]
MEKLIETVLRYRLAVLFVLGILIIGSVVLLTSMPAGVFPNATFPRILVQVERGYAPLTDMEMTTTKPLEDALRNVEGVRIVRSKTSRGYAEIELYFDWDIDLMQAYQLVQAKISDVRGKLPPGAGILVKRMTTSAYPMSGYAIFSDARSQRQLRDLAEFTIRPLLSGVSGVYQIEIVGGERPEFLVQLKPEKLALYKISPLTIENNLKQINQVKFLGKITDKYRIHLGFQNDLFRNIDDLKNSVIASVNGIPVKLSDLADVTLTSKEEYIITTANWRRAVLIDVLKQPNANGVSVGNKIDEIIAEIKSDLPADVRLEKTYDQESFVKRSITGVSENILIGILIISLIVLFFLRSFRASWSIIIFMPLVMILSFFLMYIFNLSINIMTLGGVAAALGILVDNATVVVENIIRRRSEGQSLDDAIVKGSAEVIPPMFGATITTVIVFVPLIFVSGLTGIFFKPMALTLAIAVFISLLLAISVTPILTRIFLSKKNQFKRQGDFLSGIRNGYEKILQFLLRKKIIVFALLLIVAGVSGFLYPRLHTGFLPEWDEGAFVMNYKAPPGTSLEETNRLLLQFEKIMKNYPDIEAYSRRTGRGIAHRHPANEGDYLISLKENHKLSTFQIMNELNEKATAQVPGLFLDFVQVLPDRLKDLAGEEKPIDILIFGNDNEVLQKTAQEIYEKLKPVKGLVGLSPAELPSEPEFEIQVDHEKAAQLGFRPGEAQKLIETAVWGRVSTHIQQGMRLTAVRLRYPVEFRKNLEALKQLQILSPNGVMVPIKQIAKINIREGEAAIIHENGSLAAKVLADISGRDLGSVVKDVQDVLHKIKLPYGVSVSLGGDYESQLKSFEQLFFVLILAALLIFVVLLFEFNRFRTALAIFIGTVFSFTFVVLGLYVTKTSFDISSFIGTITVLGIVVNNGILLMDFTARYRLEGVSKSAALIQAGRVRIRPILMTNITTIAGFLPLALTLGTGSEILQPFAIAVISGLVGSMFFSLIVIPVLYDLFEK